MNERHYDDDQLIALVTGEALEGRHVIESHLDGCSECRDVAGDIRALHELFGRSETWESEAGRPPAEPHARDLERYEDTAAWLAREEEEAGTRVGEILRCEGNPWENLKARRPWETAGVVRALLVRVRGLFHENPGASLRFADVAIELADALRSDRYPRDWVERLRGEAWKDRANALRLLGRFPEALQALDRASAHFESMLVSEPWLAMADYVRATVLREVDRFGEAFDLLASAEQVFARFGYQRRRMHCALVRSNTLFRVGRIRDAAEIQMELLKELGDDAEPEDRMTLCNNVGLAMVELGRLPEADSCFEEAAGIAKRIGMRVALLRSRWGAARSLLAAGKMVEALASMNEVRDAFDDLEMDEEVALIALDIIDVLLAIEQTEGIIDVCRALVARFAATGSPHGALRALGTIREVLGRGAMTPETIREIKGHIRKVSDGRPRLHLTLPDPDPSS